MTAKLLDGEALAARIRAECTDRAQRLRDHGVVPGLGTILAGDDPASARYVAMKREEGEQVGIRSEHAGLPADVSQSKVLETIRRFNEDPAIHSILLQLPLPDGLDEEEALLAIDPAKDVDGLHPVNLGRLVMGHPGPLPCTPNGIVELLAANDVPVEGKHAVIVGRGITIGRPLALLLAMRRPGCNAAVTVVHTGVEDLGAYVRTADVVVAAAGRAGLITPDMIKPGAAVVGAGTTFAGRKLLSDLADGVADVAGWITPRLGGVGPMTRAMLLRNVLAAAERAPPDRDIRPEPPASMGDYFDRAAAADGLPIQRRSIRYIRSTILLIIGVGSIMVTFWILGGGLRGRNLSPQQKQEATMISSLTGSLYASDAQQGAQAAVSDAISLTSASGSSSFGALSVDSLTAQLPGGQLATLTTGEASGADVVSVDLCADAPNCHVVEAASFGSGTCWYAIDVLGSTPRSGAPVGESYGWTDNAYSCTAGQGAVVQPTSGWQTSFPS